MTAATWGRLALLLIAAGSLGSESFAADLGAVRPFVLRPVAYDWSGLHVAITGGGVFDNGAANYSYENVDPATVAILPQGASFNSRGGIVGGALGYDIQTGGWVVGLESDISWTNFGDSNTQLVPGNPSIGFPPITFETNYKMDWISTVRGSIGLPLDHWLIYGTGGLAVAGVSMNSTVTVGNPPLGQLLGSTDKTKAGWTLGGGAEYAICSNVTLKAEALWFDLGSISLNATNPIFNSALDVDQKVEGVIARAGIGYRF